jgi:hypothetical protein
MNHRLRRSHNQQRQWKTSQECGSKVDSAQLANIWGDSDCAGSLSTGDALYLRAVLRPIGKICNASRDAYFEYPHGASVKIGKDKLTLDKIGLIGGYLGRLDQYSTFPKKVDLACQLQPVFGAIFFCVIVRISTRGTVLVLIAKSSARSMNTPLG